MASPSGKEELEKLKQNASQGSRGEFDDQVRQRAQVQHAQAQQRLAEVIDDSTTLPTTLSSVTVLNAPNTRHDFLSRVFQPILSTNQDGPYTLGEALSAVSKATDKLSRFDIFHSPISLYFDRPSPTSPTSTPTDLDAYISVVEKSRILLSSGTWAGTNDGSVYFNAVLRNLFGGAESLNANASFGTRTRSAYSGGFETPVLSNPDLRVEVGGLQSATQKAWASHEERLRGGFAKVRWSSEDGTHRHEFSYNGMWRQLTGLAEKASQTVRADAGDSFKSSILHTWTHDRRDYPLLPTRGYLLRTTSEIAGLGPLKGDVAFGKLEAESQLAMPIPIPGLSSLSDTGISLTASLRGGLLYPLTLSGSSRPTQSRINDRFLLGGPTDVRGFRLSGLGPRDGSDAVGGDVYAAGGLGLQLPFPRAGKDQPLRLQAFINGGRLIALKDTSSSQPRAQNASTSPDLSMSASNGFELQDDDWPTTAASTTVLPPQAAPSEGVQLSAADVRGAVGATLRELGEELPSMAAGVGIVYALPVARIELNFTLPLVLRRGEEGRKGLGLGIGIQFL